ncbi:MAG: methylated-DNA--[protein]-cysteine S-methyltransferase [Rhodobacterales bacterium]|nr:methylated-DNA--[protein]-cysteine S-methyltransferase [Rhodobacterales bacterium]
MHQVYNIEQNFSYQASIEDKIFLKELSEQQSFSETDFLKSHKNRNLLINEFIKLKSDCKKLTTRLDISYEYKKSPFGKALIMNSKYGICGLAFCDQVNEEIALADMMSRWPSATYSAENIFSDLEFKSVLDQTTKINLCLIGSPLQLQVWSALLKIPAGKVTNYKTLAKHIGKPKAVRSIATAIGKNPLSWFIPCHRVLRSNGELGGYHWGLKVKTTMLRFESI